MADRRRHRGPHPQDATSFADEVVTTLRQAVEDYSWLLTRKYTYPSALKLVGDRYRLGARQRLAVRRSSCCDQSLAIRRKHEVMLSDIAARPVILDGYNVLTTIESAIAGGVLLIGRDGAIRDMASMHGSWRRVQETVPAAILVGKTLADAGAMRATWLLDSPVSNSGRLKQLLEAAARESGWKWTVELVHDPDEQLKYADDVVATADSAILDLSPRWVNLARYIVRSHVDSAWMLDLTPITSSPITSNPVTSNPVTTTPPANP